MYTQNKDACECIILNGVLVSASPGLTKVTAYKSYFDRLDTRINKIITQKFNKQKTTDQTQKK